MPELHRREILVAIVDAGNRASRINAFDLNGTLLWSYEIPNPSEVTPNARRRHGGIWLMGMGDTFGVCAFFVDTQATYCVDQEGREVALLQKQKDADPGSFNP